MKPLHELTNDELHAHVRETVVDVVCKRPTTVQEQAPHTLRGAAHDLARRQLADVVERAADGMAVEPAKPLEDMTPDELHQHSVDVWNAAQR